MYHFATLFDRNFLFKGIALYNSLNKTCQEFTLHILCMDEFTSDVLTKLNLANARVISLAEFEDDELKAVKRTRSPGEYCWTCTPSLLLYVLTADPKIDFITYLDADLLFFSDVHPVFSEFGNDSIMIIEHRFAEDLKYLEVYGIYNVQLITFRRDVNGLGCLKWWRERCLEWCYNRLEDGKFGDQKYLDDWLVRFDGVHLVKHLGAGVAPWNVAQYDVRERGGQIWINGCPLVFYHFHRFEILANGKYSFASPIYTLSKELPACIYRVYIEQIEKSMAMVRNVAPDFSLGIRKASMLHLRQIAGRYLPQVIKNFLKSMQA